MKQRAFQEHTPDRTRPQRRFIDDNILLRRMHPQIQRRAYTVEISTVSHSSLYVGDKSVPTIQVIVRNTLAIILNKLLAADFSPSSSLFHPSDISSLYHAPSTTSQRRSRAAKIERIAVFQLALKYDKKHQHPFRLNESMCLALGSNQCPTVKKNGNCPKCVLYLQNTRHLAGTFSL